MIFYLIYLSSAAHLFSDDELAEILLVSRVKNTRRSITGMLLYHEGNILQVLEGEKDEVMNLYAKIEEDVRHHNVIRLIAGVSNERNFPDWSMGFKTATDKEWKEYEGYLKLNPGAIIPSLKQTNLKIDTMIKSFLTVNVRH